jgi:hypothetical protein
MGFGGLRHDGEAQARTRHFDCASAPEALEDALPILERDASASVGHDNRSIRRNTYRHLCLWRRMTNGVFDEIAQRVADRVGVTTDPNRIVRRIKTDQLGGNRGAASPRRLAKAATRLQRAAEQRASDVAPVIAGYCFALDFRLFAVRNQFFTGDVDSLNRNRKASRVAISIPLAARKPIQTIYRSMSLQPRARHCADRAGTLVPAISARTRREAPLWLPRRAQACPPYARDDGLKLAQRAPPLKQIVMEAMPIMPWT